MGITCKHTWDWTYKYRLLEWEKWESRRWSKINCLGAWEKKEMWTLPLSHSWQPLSNSGNIALYRSRERWLTPGQDKPALLDLIVSKTEALGHLVSGEDTGFLAYVSMLCTHLCYACRWGPGRSCGVLLNLSV